MRVWKSLIALTGLGLISVGASARAAEGESAPDQSAPDKSSPDQGTSSTETLDCHEAGVTVTFATGSSAINERGRTSLNGVVRWLNDDDTRKVQIQGYTDKTGSSAINEQLRGERADAAKSYIETRGIAGDRIEVIADGKVAERPDLKNTRAVTVTACEQPASQAHAQAEPPPAAPPPEPAPEPAPQPAPPPETNVNVNVPPATPPPVMAAAPAPKSDKPPSVIGVQATVGGGVTGFFEQGARAFTSTGASYEARLAAGTRTHVALEAAYVGSAQNINALGLSTNALLLGNGAEGDLRINFTTRAIQPYIFGGAGWTRYQLQNTPVATSSIQSKDDTLQVPVGVGLSARAGRSFLLDVRATERFVFDDQMFNNAASATNAGNSGMRNWNVGARLGWEF
jgi:peptidoglycan-associated lipoprotein